MTQFLGVLLLVYVAFGAFFALLDGISWMLKKADEREEHRRVSEFLAGKRKDWK